MCPFMVTMTKYFRLGSLTTGFHLSAKAAADSVFSGGWLFRSPPFFPTWERDKPTPSCLNPSP